MGADLHVGEKVLYTSPFDNEPKTTFATVATISEPWTTGMVPIKVRLRGGRHAWTTARFLSPMASRGAQ